MHVMLTDVLTCPCCGPGHGLILLPDEVRERRVVSGSLGCPDCRKRYDVTAGVGELAVGAAVEPAGGSGTEEGAVRLAGLLGLGAGTGVVVVIGPAAGHAERLAALVEGIEVVATREWYGGGSAVRIGERLPFQSGKLRGVALTGDAAAGLLDEGARVVAPAGRLLLDPAPADATERLRTLGFRILAEGDGALVAAR